MPEANEGPAGMVTETADTSDASDPMAGFAEAMTNCGPPAPSQGEPEQAAAVETIDTDTAPESETEKPEKAPVKDEEKPDASKTVNFDGFSDAQKTTWERLLKAGHVTAEEAETARKESLFQSSWTRNNMEKSAEVKALKAKVSELESELSPMAKIRDNKRLHDAWLEYAQKAVSGEVDAEDGDTDLVDGKKAAEIVRKAIDAREAEKADRTAKEQRAYESKSGALRSAIKDHVLALGVTPDVYKTYLEAEEASLGGVDPVLVLTPEKLTERIEQRHEKATMQAKIAALEAQLDQRASKQTRTSKQSLPPAPRVAGNGVVTPLSKTEADLGLDHDWSTVQGFGFRDGR